MRNAISPRLAIRIFLNMVSGRARRGAVGSSRRGRASFDDEERLTELDGLAVLAQDLADRAGSVGLNLVHDLHRLDDADRITDLDDAADLDERFRAGARGTVEGAH